MYSRLTPEKSVNLDHKMNEFRKKRSQGPFFHPETPGISLNTEIVEEN